VISTERPPSYREPARSGYNAKQDKPELTFGKSKRHGVGGERRPTCVEWLKTN